MAFSELMIKLDHSLTEAINAIEDESGSGLSNVGRALQEKFKGWREEVNDVSSDRGFSILHEPYLWSLLFPLRCVRVNPWPLTQNTYMRSRTAAALLSRAVSSPIDRIFADNGRCYTASCA